MMRITPTAIIPSASPRPYVALASLSVSTGSRQDSSLGGNWVCCDHMSIHHNPTTGNTFGSKRLDPGFFARVLT